MHQRAARAGAEPREASVGRLRRATRVSAACASSSSFASEARRSACREDAPPSEPATRARRELTSSPESLGRVTSESVGTLSSVSSRRSSTTSEASSTTAVRSCFADLVHQPQRGHRLVRIPRPAQDRPLQRLRDPRPVQRTHLIARVRKLDLTIPTAPPLHPVGLVAPEPPHLDEAARPQLPRLLVEASAHLEPRDRLPSTLPRRPRLRPRVDPLHLRRAEHPLPVLRALSPVLVLEPPALLAQVMNPLSTSPPNPCRVVGGIEKRTGSSDARLFP